MKRPYGAARSSRHNVRPGRVALALTAVLVASGQRVASPTATGWAATGAAGEAVTLHPAADATVSAGQPDANFGRNPTLQVNGKPRWDSYLRFRVPEGAAGRAVLRLWVTEPTIDGPRVRRTDGPLAETAVNWGNRITRLAGLPVDSGALKAGSWAEWDVSRLVTGPGDVTLAVVADSSDGVAFGSRESDRSPELVVAMAAAAPRPPSPPASPPRPPAPPPTNGTTSTTTPPVPGAPPECRPNWAPAEPVAQLRDGLGEMSAFIASPNHPGWGWGIRDSGKPASLYAIKPGRDGSVRTQEFRAPGLTNGDWEDMTHTPGPAPGSGYLWILENVGNGWTGDRWIYQFAEPDPENPPPPPPLPAPPSPPAALLVGAYQWAYPDGQVNTESMFVFHGDLVVVTKTQPSRVYRFTEPLRPSVLNIPTYVGTLPAGQRLSVAALSADHRTLAVSSHGKLDVYVNRGNVHDLSALIANPVFRQDMPADNREGGSFFPYGSCDLLLVAESKTIWRLEHR